MLELARVRKARGQRIARRPVLHDFDRCPPAAKIAAMYAPITPPPNHDTLQWRHGEPP
jgi:hypothetical protein